MEQRAKRRFWVAKKKWESVCDGRFKLFKRGTNAHYSRENPGINTDDWKAYDGLILNGYDHYRVFHLENEFARGKSHINGIKYFWSYAKRRFAKFNGLTDSKFILHLKESECSSNHRNDNFASFIERIF